MQVLFIDNFRGFEKTYLSFKEVNFFVGENSTGKSSLLKLIGIITSPGFWRYQPFNNGSTLNDLGKFSEIISMGTNNKEYFEIGIFSDESDENNFSAIRLKFIEHFETSLPTLKEISYVNDKINCQVIIDGLLIRYRYSKTSLDIKEIDMLSFFSSWITSNSLNDRKFYKEQVQFIGIISIVNQLQSLILKQSEEIELNSVSFTVPSFLNNLALFAPIRTQPLSTYTAQTLTFDPTGKHAPYVLKEIFDNKDVRYILKRFGEDSGLFDDITIRKLNDESDNTPFELLLTLNQKSLNIYNVGYGVSQILPIIIEIIARPIETWFALQQPEIHLHPRAQAAFGDFIYKSNARDQQKFIIETHSDYLIDRFRIRINRAFREKAPIKLGDISQVVFFSRHLNGNKLQTIEIQSDGSYPDGQPKEFKDFFIKEQLQLITI